MRKLFAVLVVLVTPLLLSEPLPATGMMTLPVMSDGGELNVWYQLPEKMTSTTAIVFVMHGVRRNADEYRDAWIEIAKQKQFIIIVPEFDSKHFPGSRSYNLGNLLNRSGTANAEKDWSFSIIERVFQQVKSKLNNDSEKFYIFGHSAGAQFVHRLLMFKPNLPVAIAIAANAGWYTMPTTEQDFPYGLAGSGDEAVSLEKFFATPMVVLLGTADTDPNDPNLRRAPEANLQGPHRYARGHNYFEFTKDKAAELKTEFNWQLIEAPGIAHDNTRMAPFAAELISNYIKKNSLP